MKCLGVARPAAPLSRKTAVRVHASGQKIRICTGKVCTKMGSKQVLKFAQDLGLEELDVGECGCLGNCGKGPNMVILPEGITLRHVSTTADIADVLAWQLKVDVPQALIKATELRLAGNQAAMSGDFVGAIAKYQEALDLNPTRGCHMLHSNMSAAHLQAGNKEEALQHAQLAVQQAPAGFHMAYVRLIDAYYALGRFSDAAQAVQDAVKSDSRFKTLPEYKVINMALKKAGAAAIA